MAEILDAFGVDVKLLLAQMLNFGILAFLLTKFLFKPMIKVLDERREKAQEIETSAKEVADARRNMETWREEQKQQAQIEADRILKEGQQQAEKQRRKAVEETEAEITRIREKATREMEQERERVFQEAQSELAGLALVATEKILGREVTSQDTERLLKKAIEEL